MKDTKNSDGHKDWLDYLDISIKIITSVLVGLVLVFLKYNNDLKQQELENSLKFGTFTKSLIGDLIAKDTNRLQPDLALITLYHTIGQKDSTFVSELGTRIIEDYLVHAKQGQKNQIQVIAKVIRKYDKVTYRYIDSIVNDTTQNILSNRVTNVKPGAKEISSKTEFSQAIQKLDNKDLDKITLLPSKATVFIQIGSSDSVTRAFGNKLKDSLKVLGFNAPGIEAITKFKFTSIVRYYYESDLAAAKQVQLFAAGLTKEKVGIEQTDLPNVRRGLIELWINK